jgi:hypothetical protein
LSFGGHDKEEARFLPLRKLLVGPVLFVAGSPTVHQTRALYEFLRAKVVRYASIKPFEEILRILPRAVCDAFPMRRGAGWRGTTPETERRGVPRHKMCIASIAVSSASVAWPSTPSLRQ